MQVSYTASFWKAKQACDSLQGDTPSVFVGRIGYPKVFVGLLTPPDVREDAWRYDAPRHWAAANYTVSSLLELRGTLVNSRFSCGVMERNKFTALCQEVGLASNPPNVEVELEQPLQAPMTFFREAAPLGPIGTLKRARLTENPHVEKPVEKAFTDTDFKAADALVYLYKKGFDEAFLTKLLSIGALGVPHQRKMVPTRWTITAIDDTVGKSAIEEIKQYSEHDCAAFYGSYLGNYYLILFLEGMWSFELFECTLKQGKITGTWTDYESYAGRVNYAQQCAGGYYAVRLASAEKLKAAKRQAKVIALRIVTDEYTHPLGVWVTREASRKALATSPVVFSSSELVLRYAELKIKKMFSIDIIHLFAQSCLLKEQREQKTLGNYFSVR